ncbi:MAG: type IIL restriction-modification enzyme MmeI [Actinomycetota bacterium]
MLGNPPFLGGKRISGRNGIDYREFLVRWLADGTPGSADLVTYFFLRAAQVSGGFGLLATNTIAQGDTREVGLDQLTAKGWMIHRAVKSTPWPGQATLEVATTWLRHRWLGPLVLGDEVVLMITPSLDRASRVRGNPHKLAAARPFSHYGSIVHGAGFLLEPEDARDLIARDQRNENVLVPYLVGEDLNSSPTQQASRWVINFSDWPVEVAKGYPECFEIVLRRVKPERDKVRRSAYRDRWWQFAERQTTLYSAIAGFERVIVIAQTSKVIQPAFVPTHQVFSSMVVVFAFDDDFHFGLLSSAFHRWWAVTRASTMRTDLRYTPTDCFETFPQPSYSESVEHAGRALDEHRRELMNAADEGLTKTYNRVHRAADTFAGIVQLRELHVDLDHAVRDAYGWNDLLLDHGFHDTPQGVRFTISPTARVEVLDRLLELNHERYADEVRRGLHAKAKKGSTKGKGRKSARSAAEDGTLFGDG